MKIIHTADIHLDAAMQGLTPEKARARRGELLQAFTRLCEYAGEVGASAVIIAGDLFDRGEVTARVRRFVLDTVRKHPEIRFFLLFGNHDSGSLSFSDEMPENLYIFENEWRSFDLGEAVITGVELTAENCSSVYETIELDPERTNIVVMHGAATTTDGEDKINIKKLAGRGIDYLALGHFHEYSEKKLDRRGKYCYCGCLEGRGFDECGDKGFVELTLENGKISSSFVKSSIRTVIEVPVDMTGAASYTEQKERIESALVGILPESIVRARTEGELRPSEDRFFGQIERELQGKYFVLEIKDKTGIYIDRADYEGDLSLKGEFIRLVTEKVKNEEERDRIIACGLAALLGGDIE